MQKVVFLDRDGVINEDSPDYIKNVHEFQFIPGSLESIVKLSQAGFQIFILTNQSGIARGLFSLSTLADIHEFLVTSVEKKGGKITGIFFCPHLPEEACDCRKPKTGLFERAKELYDIDMANAIMIGDSAKDIIAATKAGIKTTLLVQSGYTPIDQILPELSPNTPSIILKDLLQATDWILSKEVPV